MSRNKRRYVQTLFTVCASLILIFGLSAQAFADLYFSILAVNGSDKQKEKEIRQELPADLTAEDIVDTSGLKLEYDTDKAVYIVSGKVNLNPKETKTYKIRIRDVWRIDPEEVDGIRTQIDESLNRIANTEYYETGLIKKEYLNKRLDYIIQQQEQFAENVQTRIDRFRTYSDEFQEIRSNSVSVKYWRTKPPDAATTKLFNLVIQVNNESSTKSKTNTAKIYLPSEIKPEHIVNSEGFSIEYDPEKRQPFLYREEELKPSEEKKYTIGILDVWSISDVDIENLKDRTRKAFKLLEKSEYAQTASFLVDNIKSQLEIVEQSQSIERDINEHISSFRANLVHFEKAKKDVKTLEELLDAVREKLERSQLKNVLQKIKAIRSVADISQAIFGVKPSPNNIWKLITGTVIFVAFLTILYFIMSAGKAKNLNEYKLTEAAKQKPEEPKT